MLDKDRQFPSISELRLALGDRTFGQGAGAGHLYEGAEGLNGRTPTVFPLLQPTARS